MGKKFDTGSDDHHRFMMNSYRRLEEHDRVIRKIRRPDRCPHCGERLDAPPRPISDRPFTKPRP
jgi:hypothetical protein